MTKKVIENCKKTNIWKIEPDCSSATYFLALGALQCKKVIFKDLKKDLTQGDVNFYKILCKLGCKDLKKKYVAIQGVGYKKLKRPVKNENDTWIINLEDMPDTAMTLAVICSFIKGKTRITGLSTLKYKECNRIQALYNELTKIGIECTKGSDYLEIDGNYEKIKNNIVFHTYRDHRMAMSFFLYKIIIKNMIIMDPLCVNKTYPNYYKDFISAYNDKEISFKLPASKSDTNRKLLLASLSTRLIKLKNILYCDDTEHMMNGLQELGIKMKVINHNIEIQGNYNCVFLYDNKELFIGNSGTSLRFLAIYSILAIHNNYDITFICDDRMREREILPLLSILKQFNVNFEYNKKDFLLKIKGKRNFKPQVDILKIDCSKSSQFLSSVLMCKKFLNIGEIKIQKLSILFRLKYFIINIVK